MPDDERTVVCPYNTAHVILVSRMPKHIIKCRIAHPGLKMETCPFDSTHVVQSPELLYHVENCPERLRLDSHLYVIGRPQEEKKENRDLINIPLPESNEDWDAVPEPVCSYLDQKEKILENRPVLRNKTGLSKAEKRNFHFQERLRINNLSQPSTSTINKAAGKVENTQIRHGAGRGKVIMDFEQNLNRPGVDKISNITSKLENISLLTHADHAEENEVAAAGPRVKNEEDEDGFQLVRSSRGRGQRRK